MFDIMISTWLSTAIERLKRSRSVGGLRGLGHSRHPKHTMRLVASMTHAACDPPPGTRLEINNYTS